ncbi:hypothetical protein A9995_11785 [Erythrobacter sp. QSSC1-22B]|uniref:Hpt domain-containing protein n=1 Tax=Erythrobacter sp. QSSC1-22B TaxID=1860125 RepID=UPI000805B5AB|nr:Hpt domain-containing protein [Erythrobacter sp. QSSC1-22B]OBX18628.1 hypothetical protein A9995_11785 [Erythrobacter sp. QSSC1-22B]
MTGIEGKMAELALRFSARARDERLTIAALFACQDRSGISERAHKLAGIAGMFGHPQITDAALRLEAAADGTGAMDEAAERLLDLLAEIETD